MKWPRKKPSEEVLELEKSLRETRLLIAQAYAGFNAVADPELVESYVYEIQALQARYSYLLRRRKAYDAAPEGAPLTAEALPQRGRPSQQSRTEEGPAVPILPVA